MRTLINRLAFAALLCCGLFVLTSNTQAQCPDSTGPSPDPSICPWNSTAFHDTVPGTACGDSVYYCYRTCDTFQIWIYSVVPDPTSNCDSINPVSLIWAAKDQAIKDAANHRYINVSPCFKGFPGTIVETYTPGCWFGAHNATGGNYFGGCSNFDCYCQETCDVCYDGAGGIYSITNCQNTGMTGCACGPPFPNNWTPNLCYSVECQPNPGVIEASIKSLPAIDASLRAYPNPVTGELSVSSSNAGAHFVILDVLGRQVKTGVIPTNGAAMLDVSSFPAGTYYVSEGQTEVKFVKK